MAKVAKKMAKGKILVVGNKVREYIKSKGCLTSGELIPQLSGKLCCILDCAIERAKANNRKTVSLKDIEEQEMVLEKRREEIAKNARKSMEEYKKGLISKGNVSKLMRELDND